MTLLKSAKFWHDAGIATIPIKYRDKKPEVTWEIYQHTLPTEYELEKWFTSSLHNIAVITGWQGLCVLDFDSAAIYSQWSLWCNRAGSYTQYVRDNTYQVRTARGIHIYVRLPHVELNRHLDGIDIKAGGGYVLTDPSIHPSGAIYTCVTPGAIPIRINALSDILPSSILTHFTEYLEGVVIPGRVATPFNDSDPWQSVMNAPDPDRDLIEQIRERFRVEDFFTDLEKTSSNNRWYVARCPFHTDNKPSFWVDKQCQICGCFAGCTSKPLDSIDLYARLHGLDSRHAVFEMRKLF